ncbi:MAG TPA: MFS transporter [Anaerolineaceae bacterium]|nr:MFS transporter [Anaerolineaceae bacterium]
MEQDSELISDVVLETTESHAGQVNSSDQFDSKGVTLIAFAHGLHDTYSSWLGALLPVLIEKFTMTNTMAGALSMALTIPSVLQPIFGYTADRKNLRWMIVVAPAITALVMTNLGIIPSFNLLFLFLLIAGLGAAGLHSVGPGVASYFSGKSIGKGMSFWMIGGELGYSVGPLLATSMVGLIGFTRLPLLGIGGVLVSLFLAYATRDVDTRCTSKNLKINRPVFMANMKQVMLPIVLLLITRALAGVMLGIFLPTFLQSQGASLTIAGAGMAVAGAAGVVGAYIAGTLSDKVGRRKILSVAIVLTPIFMLLFLNAQGWVKIPLLILSGLFGLSLLPVMMSTIMKFFPEDRSFANGIFMSLNFIIQSLGALLAGRIADLKGMPFTFMVAALAMPLGLLALLLMPKDHEAQGN